MDFIKTYSTILSQKEGSNPEKGASQPKPKAPQAKASPPQEQKPEDLQISQPALSYAPFEPRTGFAQLMDDAMHNFKKAIGHAMDVGIQEQLAVEKAALLMQVQQLQEKNIVVERENASLREISDKLQTENAHQAQIVSKMAELISDLKNYRKDSLYSQRIVLGWHLVAAHGQKQKRYENMLVDQKAARTRRSIFLSWQNAAFRKQNNAMVANASEEIRRLQAERENYFQAERDKYTAEIKLLKSELGQFAVKERKMKDAMKQAFLKGINAISEQATCAMDKADRMGMPPTLQRELEQTYTGNKDDVDVLSEGQIEEFKGFDQVEEEMHQVLAASQRSDLSQRVQIKAGSPASKVGSQLQPQRADMTTVQDQLHQSPAKGMPAPKPEPKPQRVPAVYGVAQQQQFIGDGNLASKLRNATRVKQDPSTLLYKESVRGVNVRIEKEQ